MIDSHAHLSCPQVLPVVDAIVKRAKEAGIKPLFALGENSREAANAFGQGAVFFETSL